MSEDIIEVNGKEYELDDGGYSIKAGKDGLIILEVRPKRKQTGWVCKSSHPCTYRCYEMRNTEAAGGGSLPGKPKKCFHGQESWIKWEPVYEEGVK